MKYFDDDVEREPSRFGDRLIGKADNQPQSKQFICTGKHSVRPVVKKNTEEKKSEEKQFIIEHYPLKGIQEAIKDKEQEEQLKAALLNDEFKRAIQEEIKNIDTDSKCGFPYHIGTYVVCVENGNLRVDKVSDYIVNKDGIFVVLTLDALTSPRTSAPVMLDKFNETWVSYEIAREVMFRFIISFGMSFQEFNEEYPDPNVFNVNFPNSKNDEHLTTEEFVERMAKYGSKENSLKHLYSITEGKSSRTRLKSQDKNNSTDNK